MNRETLEMVIALYLFKPIPNLKKWILGLLWMGCALTTAAQDKAINWLSFEQLEDSLSKKPKKVLVYFYTDWCVYCKKMDQVAFQDAAVVAKLNQHYYAVRMNAESTDTIVFGGDSFVNQQLGSHRKPTHEIPLLLASRENYPFSLPALVFLNEKFEVTRRNFTYLDGKALWEALK